MVQETLVYQKDIPFHIRPIGMFTTIARNSDCEVTVSKGDKKVEGTSTMQLLQLCVTKNEEVTVTVSGKNEKETLVSLVDVIKHQ